MTTKLTELEKWALSLLYRGRVVSAIDKAVMPTMLGLEKKKLANVQYTDGMWSIRLTPLGENVAALHNPSSYRYFPIVSQQVARDTNRLHKAVQELGALMIESEQDWDLSEDTLAVMNESMYSTAQQSIDAKDIELDNDDKMIFVIVSKLLTHHDAEIGDSAIAVAKHFMAMGLFGNTGTDNAPCFYITPTGEKVLNCIFLEELDFWARGAALMNEEDHSSDAPSIVKKRSKSTRKKTKSGKNNENTDAESAQQE